MSYEHALRVALMGLVAAGAYLAGRNDENDGRGSWWALVFVGYAVGLEALPWGS